jgi:hypothetical protein
MTRGGERITVVVLFAAFVLAYAANGREIGTYDSRPTELAARELLLRGTLSLNHVVGAVPEYAHRWGFILARDGRYRAIYSPVPSLVAAAVIWPLWRTGLIDIRAPLATQLIGKVTATLLVALAAVVSYTTARRALPRGKAVLVACGLALGTGWWSSASQTLWQSETAVFGLAVAVAAFVRLESPSPGAARAVALIAGLTLAGTSRPQLTPAIAIILAGVWMRAPRRLAFAVSACVAVAAAALALCNWRWFGNVLGAQPLLVDVNRATHATDAMFRPAVDGVVGLLLSPSRGLLVFSPVVLVAVAGVRSAARAGWRGAAIWCLGAAVTQFAVYSMYGVWWGGHTYGPRYLLDTLPLLVPLATLALVAPRSRVWHAAACVALAWSIAVAATGAFVYPHEAWNSDPDDVDTHHERLWAVWDGQIERCWRAGLSPQNFALFDRAAVRRAAETSP